jgi:hypothetical protein
MRSVSLGWNFETKNKKGIQTILDHSILLEFRFFHFARWCWPRKDAVAHPLKLKIVALNPSCVWVGLGRSIHACKNVIKALSECDFLKFMLWRGYWGFFLPTHVHTYICTYILYLNWTAVRLSSLPLRLRSLLLVLDEDRFGRDFRPGRGPTHFNGV